MPVPQVRGHLPGARRKPDHVHTQCCLAWCSHSGGIKSAIHTLTSKPGPKVKLTLPGPVVTSTSSWMPAPIRDSPLPTGSSSLAVGAFLGPSGPCTWSLSHFRCHVPNLPPNLAGLEELMVTPTSNSPGASEPRNMIYMSRLGIWGEGTPFRTFEDFLHAIEKR